MIARGLLSAVSFAALAAWDPVLAEDKPVGLPEVKVIANTPLAPASPPPAARGARRQGFVGTGSYCGIGGR
jgi:hypothetical protein